MLPILALAAVVLGLVYFVPDFSHQLCLSVAVFALGLVSLPLFPPLVEACCQWSVVSAGLSLEDCVCILKLFQPLCVSGFLSLAPVLCVSSTFITKYNSGLYMKVCLVEFLLSKMRPPCLLL